MINDCALGLFKAVIVHKFDRFSRDRYDSAFYKRQLKRQGVKLISVLEPLDGSPESIILESVLEGMAEYYSKNLARETMKGLKENAYKAKFNGGIPPLGYDVDKEGKYVVNENEAQAVRIIFNMYCDGHSYKEIITALRSFRTKRGKPFGKNSLHEILKNERYTGVYIFNQAPKVSTNGKFNKRQIKDESEIIKVPGGIPLIIDNETFMRVRVRMENNKKNAMYGAEVVYLLTGLLYCGECGASMIGNRRVSRDKVYASYECGERKRKHTCKAKSITKGKIEGIVIQELEHNIFNKFSMEKVAEMVVEYANKQAEDVVATIKRIKSDIAGVQRNMDNIINAVAEGMFHSSMKDKLTDLEKRKSLLQMELYSIERKSVEVTKEMVIEYLMTDMDISSRTDEQQKIIINRYVKQINLHPDRVEVNYVVDTNGCGTRI